MNSKAENTLNAILRKRQQEEFIGRKHQSIVFERNLSVPVDNRYFVFNVSGQAGVGKTNLLRRFRALAENSGALTAWCDTTEREPAVVMGSIVRQLEARGYQLKKFAERHKVYRQR